MQVKLQCISESRRAMGGGREQGKKTGKKEREKKWGRRERGNKEGERD